MSTISETAPWMMTPGLYARKASRGKWFLAKHLKQIDKVLEAAILHRKTPSIIVFEAPPRHGKSEFISKYLPAWYLSRFPQNRVMLSSYEANFAKSWGRKARETFSEFGAPIGRSVSRIVSAADNWETNYGGGMVTAGVGGPLTGKGANLLIVDDPIKNDEQALSPTIREKHWDWWQSTASTRIEPGGLAIVMNTRWHKEDLAGRLISAAESGEGPEVLRVRFPAIAEENDHLGREPGEALWPDRWPLEILLQRRNALDPFWWNALYQQRPSRAGRMEWPDDYFGEKIWADDWPSDFEITVIACDPSKGKDSKRGDYAALVMLGLRGGRLWVDSVVRRMPPAQIVETGIELAQRYHPEHFGVESNMFQELLATEFDRKTQEMKVTPLPIALINNTVNKDLRIGRLGTYLARDLFRFRRTGDNHRLVEQMKEWPLGDHDDGPDGLEMAVRLMNWATGNDGEQGGRVTA